MSPGCLGSPAGPEVAHGEMAGPRGRDHRGWTRQEAAGQRRLGGVESEHSTKGKGGELEGTRGARGLQVVEVREEPWRLLGLSRALLCVSALAPQTWALSSSVPVMARRLEIGRAHV